jgi:hypothetical protein
VCYVKQVGTRQWAAKALQACKGNENKKWLDLDKKGGSKAKEEVYFWFKLCCSLCRRKSLQESVVVVLFFCYANDYIMAGSMFLLELRFIKG